MHIVGEIVEIVLFVFLALMFVRMVMSWVQVFARSWVPTGLLLLLLEGVYSATDPPIRGVRKVVPPLRIGNAAFDVAFFLVFIAAVLLQSLNRSLLLYS